MTNKAKRVKAIITNRIVTVNAVEITKPVARQRNCAATSRQSGSALVEASILMMVLLPVIYGVAMLGKMIDLKQTAEQASRYAAWEATVYSAAEPNGAAPPAVAQRFFGEPASSIQTHNLEMAENPLWGKPRATRENQYEEQTRVAIKQQTVATEYQRNIADATAAMSVGQVIGKSGELLDGLSGNSWGLTPDGLVQANVGVEIESSSWLGEASEACGEDSSSICLSSSAVILVDGWSASDDTQAERRVRSLVPASALEPLGDAVAIVGKLPLFGELKGLEGAFGHVDMRVLPEYAKP